MNVNNVTAEDLSNTYIKEAVGQFEKYLRQIRDNTNFKVEVVGSGDFYLDDIYEVDPAYRDRSNNLSYSDYNVHDKLPYADDIDKYYELIGTTFMLYPNTGDNKNTAIKPTVKRRVLENLGNPVGRAHAKPLLHTR